MDAARHQRLKLLFEQARQLDGAERGLFLARACGDDAALRTELEALLGHHREQTLLKASPTASRDVTKIAARSMLKREPTRVTSAPAPSLVALWSSLATLIAVLVIGWGLHQGIREALLAHQMRLLEIGCRQAADAVRHYLEDGLREAERWGINDELAIAIRNGNRHPIPAEQRKLETFCPEFSARLVDRWGPEVTCTVWNREQTKVLGLANNMTSMLAPSTDTGARILNRVLKGESAVYLPNSLEMISQGFRPPAGARVMSFIVPVRETADGPIEGALLLRYNALEDRFHELFGNGVVLETGELFAFTEDARMISRPRFAEALEQLGLVERPADLPSTSYVSLRDPGGDLTTGHEPAEARSMQVVIDVVRRSLVEPRGTTTQVFRDYRGRASWASWEWLEPFGFGIMMRVDQAELEAPLRLLDRASLATLVLIAGMLLTISGSTAWRRWRAAPRAQGLARVGPYRLEVEIGGGGMGQVYRARHDLLKRPTAVKLIRPEHATPSAYRRFEREVQLACQLRHPNTVSIYDYGRAEDGRVYYVMEYLTGGNLQQLVELFGPQPPARVLYLLRQICGSLGEAHAAGWVHRDIKPQNIMICNCGGATDFVKVLDFGLVKPMELGPGEAETTVGEWVGTPKYMAPERLLQPKLADARGDIYSLGVTLYWVLAGREPFEGSIATSLLSSLITESPQPFPAELRIPEALQRLVFRCLAKLPSERFATLAELWSAAEGIALAETWSAEDAHRWWTAHLSHLLLPPRDLDPEMSRAANAPTVVYPATTPLPAEPRVSADTTLTDR